MSYKSPIEVFVKQTSEKKEEFVSDKIMESVEKIGVSVDREELVKALKYDREQYEKGYSDGKNSIPVGYWIIGKTIVSGRPTSTCSVCRQEPTGKIGGDIKHIFMGDAVACPLCGARMKGQKKQEEIE